MALNKKQLFFGGLFAVVMLFAVALFVPQQNALADGAVGGAGGASGCSGCPGVPHTNHGYGWYNFGVNDDGPADISGGGSWSSARDRCVNTGNDRVIAFIIQRPSGGPGNSSIYPYVSEDYYGYSLYNGDNGGNWLTFNQAKALYDTLPGNLKLGYTWGSNVAWFCYNSASEWYLRGDSYIQKGALNRNAATKDTITARPGERLNWYHDMRNNGPENMDRDIYFNIGKSGFSNGWNGNADPQGWRRGNAGQLFMTNYATNGGAYTLYDVTQNDVGNTLCQRINWQPISWNNGGVGQSNNACAVIPYSYALTPQIIDMTDNEVIENAIGPIPVSGRVTNSGDTKSHPNIQWQLTQVLYAPGDDIPQRPGGIDLRDPCTFFTGEIAGSCTATSSGSGTEAAGYAYRETKTYNATGTLGDRAVGTRICFAMSVRRNASVNTDWRHSQMYCRVVGKEPKVQVLGGDLIVGRESASNPGRQSDVDTSVTQPLSGRYFGSWAEYAIVASGNVRGMASGSGYVGADGGGSTTDVMCSLSYLTFTNGGNPGCSVNNIGLYEHTRSSPNTAGRFPISTSTPRITTPDVTLSDMQGLYTTNQATLNISGGADIGIDGKRGQEVIINAPNTTVTITDNIRYTGDTLTNIREIPQVIIIAQNIIVQDDVENIDSWLIAVGSGNEGRINTCGGSNDDSITEGTQPHAGQCGLKLTINGPVSANHLFLKRTAGSGTGVAAGEPAEVINLRADSYVWASGYSPGTGRLPTVTSTELPPRF